MNFQAAKAFILNQLDVHLSDTLYYHGKHHTLDVLKISEKLASIENLKADDVTLLLTAALYHDSGFTRSYSDHEKHGCDIARESLPQFNYSKNDVEKICGMIIATKIPQSPKTKLEEIICDADLDYLGRNDFYTIGNTLFQELKERNFVASVDQWNDIQIRFLDNHHYFTTTNIETREERKQEYLRELKQGQVAQKNI